MAKNKNAKTPDQIEGVQNVINKSEAFIEKYQKEILYVLLGVVVLALAVIGAKKFYVEPREADADNQIAIGQNYFERDSFKIALEGDGIDFIGFEQIVSDYWMTKKSNTATAYAGISFYKTGDYENAIKYLKKYNGNGDVNLTPVILGLIGDAYVELGDVQKGIKYFLKAVKKDNSQLSPVYLKKAAIAYESQGNYQKALNAYTQIKTKYFNSFEANDIEKYIERVNTLTK